VTNLCESVALTAVVAAQRTGGRKTKKMMSGLGVSGGRPGAKPKANPPSTSRIG
jgi:hypothetical protein